jgi:DNA-directed RNA polymerase sigma subunit (sigma70/sigma32)
VDDDALLTTYLEEVRRFSTLTPDEERALLDAARRGDEEARRSVSQGQLVAAAEFALAVARPWMRSLDAIQEANLVLFRLIDDEKVSLVSERLHEAVGERLSRIQRPRDAGI